MLNDRNDISQRNLLQQANAVLKKLHESNLPEQGICAPLSNIFIRYASKKRRAVYLQKITAIANLQHTEEPDYKDFKIFVREIRQEIFSPSLFVTDMPCLDAFSIATNSLAELTTHLEIILKNLQTTKQARYAHVTLANIHSFVIEQECQQSNFSYYVYDPNNKTLPKSLCDANEIADEIVEVAKRADLDSNSTDKNISLLITFYIYTNNELEEKDSLLERIKSKVSLFKINDKIEEKEFRHCINILSLIKRYKEGHIAKNILLMNAIHLMKQSSLDFKSDIVEVSESLSTHLLSNQFNSKSHFALEFFPAEKTGGKVTLFHEICKIGDIECVMRILPTIKCLPTTTDNLTPLMLAIAEAHLLIVTEILAFTTSLKMEINLTSLIHDARYCESRYIPVDDIEFSVKENETYHELGAIVSVLNNYQEELENKREIINNSSLLAKSIFSNSDKSAPNELSSSILMRKPA